MMPCGGLHHGQLELSPWTFPEPWRVVHLSVRDRSLTSPALQGGDFRISQVTPSTGMHSTLQARCAVALAGLRVRAKRVGGLIKGPEEPNV